MKIHNVIFRTGYVEDTSNACVALHNYDGFDTVEGALRNISEAFLEAYEEQEYFARPRSECCGLWDKTRAQYCGECGTKLEAERTNREEIEEFVKDYFGGTIIDPSEPWHHLSVRGWYRFGYDDQNDFTNVVIATQNGEIVIARMAMGETMFADDKNGRFSHEFYRPYLSIPDDAKLFIGE